MKKIVSLILIVICIVGLTACSKNKTITDIASFDSPDGQYILVFQQVGEPFSFGPADVRLTLKEKSGAVVDSIDEKVFNDGANAFKENIKDVDWTYDSVIVTLYSTESPDKTVAVRYNID